MKRLCFSIALLALVSVTLAATPNRETSPKTEVLTAGFLDFHPDLKYRIKGITAYQKGEMAAALDAFQKSARYADKASQAMVAEMLWKGEGTPADLVLAYVWMDLAAERGFRSFSARREIYWQALDAEQRDAALAAGPGVFAKYGDDVAQPRLERKLNAGRRSATGSRVGSIGGLQIRIPGPGGYTTIDGSTYYASHYWRPDEYFEWQNDVWNVLPQTHVDVGPISIGEIERKAEPKAN